MSVPNKLTYILSLFLVLAHIIYGNKLKNDPYILLDLYEKTNNNNWEKFRPLTQPISTCHDIGMKIAWVESTTFFKFEGKIIDQRISSNTIAKKSKTRLVDSNFKAQND